MVDALIYWALTTGSDEAGLREFSEYYDLFLIENKM